MRVGIVTTCVPHIYGGAEFLADSLKAKLEEYGHRAAIVRIPFKWHPPEAILEHMVACRLIEVRNVDRVIALKFPAYYVDHPDKRLWLLHQFRQAYDLWGTPFQDIPPSPQGLRIRDAIIRSDNVFLREAKHIFTNSRVVSERLKKFNGIDSEVLFPPLMESEKFYCEEYGNYIFYPSRITRGKRQWLVAEAMRYVRSGVRLVIAGSPDTPGELEPLESLVGKHRLQQRVEVLGRFISQEEKARMFAGALGCVYVPYDEDSYGYVSLEAYHSKKPVVTCSDSGGTLEVVEDGKTGLVVPPEPRALAAAFDRLYQDRDLARRMGEAGLERVQAMGITWDNVIGRLTG